MIRKRPFVLNVDHLNILISINMFTPEEKIKIKYYRDLVKDHFNIDETVRIYNASHLPYPYKKKAQIQKTLAIEKQGGFCGYNRNTHKTIIILKDTSTYEKEYTFEEVLTHELGHYIDFYYAKITPMTIFPPSIIGIRYYRYRWNK